MSHQAQITALNHNGEGICKKNDGKIVFVPYTLPGETVLIEIEKEKKNWARGKLQKILVSSPDRQEPRCDNFYLCGGCSLQHLNYVKQAKFKEQMVQEILERIGGFKNIKVQPILEAVHSYAYRNKITLHWKNTGENTQLGFYSPGSHFIVDTEQCHLVSSLINSTLKTLSHLIKYYNFPRTSETKQITIKQSVIQKEVMVIFEAPDSYAQQLKQLSRGLNQNLPFVTSVWHRSFTSYKTNNNQTSNFVLLYGKEKLREGILDKSFYLSPASFLQVNIPQAEKLYKTMLHFFQIKKPLSLAVDLYCGVGTTTLFLAGTAEKVIGVDAFAPGIKDAIENAKVNGILTTSFFSGTAEKQLPKIIKEEGRPDAALLNPPRQGCSNDLLKEIIYPSIPFISYISCNPATLSRDEKFLSENGYCPGAVQPVDMFPQTSHVECITTMVKGNS